MAERNARRPNRRIAGKPAVEVKPRLRPAALAIAGMVVVRTGFPGLRKPFGRSCKRSSARGTLGRDGRRDDEARAEDRTAQAQMMAR